MVEEMAVAYAWHSSVWKWVSIRGSGDDDDDDADAGGRDKYTQGRSRRRKDESVRERGVVEFLWGVKWNVFRRTYHAFINNIFQKLA